MCRHRCLCRGQLTSRASTWRATSRELRHLFPRLVEVLRVSASVTAPLLLEIKGHFLREEESGFDRMRAFLSADELAELASRVHAAKRHAPRFPDDHPRVTTDRVTPPEGQAG